MCEAVRRGSPGARVGIAALLVLPAFLGGHRGDVELPAKALRLGSQLLELCGGVIGGFLRGLLIVEGGAAHRFFPPFGNIPAAIVPLASLF